MNLLPATENTKNRNYITDFQEYPQDRFHSIQVPTVASFLLSVGCVCLRSVVHGSDFATYFSEFWETYF